MNTCYVCGKKHRGKDQDYCTKCIKNIFEFYKEERENKLNYFRLNKHEIIKTLNFIASFLEDL